MNPPVCRLLPYAIAGGPENMAADTALLETAGQGVASLRFYGWCEATVSLGYFQQASVRLSDRLSGLPFVRRPSGGATLVHHHEVTYALALPAGLPWQPGGSWLIRMHGIIAAALCDLGVATVPQQGPAPPFLGHLCFQHFAAGDLIISTAKITGSAQRKQRGSLLQHGAILLTQSPHAPELPGIRELAGKVLEAEAVQDAVVRRLIDNTGWQVQPGAWRESEQQRRLELTERFAGTAWNGRR
jgi:lipoate-protein ligase A